MQDPWFVYQKGRGRHRIVPRNAKGFVSFFIFMALVLSPILPMAMLHLPPIWTAPLSIWFLALLWLFFRFAVARSEIRMMDDD